MPTLIIPSERTERKTEAMQNLYAYIKEAYSVNFDDVSEEDTDYRNWLFTHGERAYADVTKYIAKLKKERPGDELLTVLDNKLTVFGKLTSELGRKFVPVPEEVPNFNIPLRTDEEIRELEEQQSDEWLEEKALREKEKEMNDALIQKEKEFERKRAERVDAYLSDLVGVNPDDKDAVSFSDAVSRFNNATGQKYADDSEMKTIMKMIRRTEHVCGEFEAAAIADYNAEVEERCEKLDVIAEQTKGYLKADKELADSIKDKEKLNPDNIESVYNNFEKSIDEYNVKLTEKAAQLEEKRKDLGLTKEEIAEAEREYAETSELIEDKDGVFRDFVAYREKKIADAASEKDEAARRIEVNERKIAETEKALDMFESSVKAVESSREQEKEVLQRTFKSTYGKNFFDRMQEPKDARSLAATENVGKDYADKESAQALFDSDFGKTFMRLYDKYKPAPKAQTGVRGFLSGMFAEKPAANGREALQRCIDKTKFGKDANDLDKYLKTETEKLRDAVEAQVKKSGDDKKFAEYENSLQMIENRVPAMQKERAEKEQSLKDLRIQTDRDKKAIAEADKRIAQSKKEIEQGTSAREGVKKRVTAAEEKLAGLKEKAAQQEKEIAELHKSREEDKAIMNKAAGYCREYLDEPMAKLKERNAKSSEMKADMADYRSKRQAAVPTVKDRRMDRVNARLDGFLRRISDNQGSHINSKEYNDLVDALVTARQGGMQALEKTIPALQTAADTYLRLKGSRTISIGNIRSTRMSFAREIRDYSKGLAGTLNAPVYPDDDDIPEENSLFENDGTAESKDVAEKMEALRNAGNKVKAVPDGMSAFSARPKRLGDVYKDMENAILSEEPDKAFSDVTKTVDAAEKEIAARQKEANAAIIRKTQNNIARRNDGNVIPGNEAVLPG